VWSVTTFFVVPVIAYENLGPIGAFKRSIPNDETKWVKPCCWFQFGLIKFLAILIIGFLLFLIGSIVHPFFRNWFSSDSCVYHYGYYECC